MQHSKGGKKDVIELAGKVKLPEYFCVLLAVCHLNNVPHMHATTLED
jgi:hypothetical protein